MPYDLPQTTNDELILDLITACNKELKSIHLNDYLLSLLPEEEIKQPLLEMKQDDMRHLESISTCYTYLTGITFKEELNEAFSSTLQEGFIMLLKEKQATIHFYQEIARKSKNPSISSVFRSTALEEQHHTTWLLFFIFSQK